jgi:hypothetical protein
MNSYKADTDLASSVDMTSFVLTIVDDALGTTKRVSSELSLWNARFSKSFVTHQIRR